MPVSQRAPNGRGFFDEQGKFYFDQDPFRQALLSFNDIYNSEGEITRPAARLALPSLQSPNPTARDLELYEQIQRVYEAASSPATFRPDGETSISNEQFLSSQLRDQILYGQLHPGYGAYTDPGLQAYAQGLISDIERDDPFSVLGDQLIPALALFGVAVGGAAAAGGFAAEAGATGAAGAAGAAEAGATGAAGAAGAAGEGAALASPLPATFGPGVQGLAGTAIGAPEAASLGFVGGAAPAVAGGSPLIPAAGVAAGAGPTLGELGAGAALLGGAGGVAAGAGEGAAAAAPTVASAAPEAAAPVLSSGTTAAGGSTVPSTTGLTTGQVLRAAPSVISLGTAVAGAAGAGGGGGGSGTGDAETDALYQRLRALAAQSAPEAQALALQGEQTLRQRAAGSPAALLRQLGPQVRDLRQKLENAYTNISKRLGSTGGAQIDRHQGAAVGEAGQALQKLLAQGQAQGQEGLYTFLRNLRPALLTQLPQLNQTTIPFNYQNLGRGVAEGLTLGQRLFPGQSTTAAGTTGGDTLGSTGGSFYAPSGAFDAPLGGDPVYGSY